MKTLSVISLIIFANYGITGIITCWLGNQERAIQISADHRTGYIDEYGMCNLLECNIQEWGLSCESKFEDIFTSLHIEIYPNIHMVGRAWLTTKIGEDGSESYLHLMCDEDEQLNSDDPILDNYVCDMSNAPMCRRTRIMPPDANCSELADDRDCNIDGKIPGKYCRLFGNNDCRQVITCSDLTSLGQQGCHGEILGRLFGDPQTKFCAWDNQECKEIVTMPLQTECSALGDTECEIPHKIPGKACRLFGVDDCRRVNNCEDLTPLGYDRCSGSVWSAYCGWAENACHSYYH